MGKQVPHSRFARVRNDILKDIQIEPLLGGSLDEFSLQKRRDKWKGPTPFKKARNGANVEPIDSINP